MNDYVTDLLPPNFPTKRITDAPRTLTFPRDLVTTDRNFYTAIQFVDYSYNLAYGATSQAVANIRPQVILPIPRKVNDTQTVVWEAESFTSAAASAAASIQQTVGRLTALASAAAVRGPVEAVTGFTVNPFLWMLFKQPGFKEYNLTWTLSPSNESESNDVRNIINYLKENMLPEKAFAGVFYNYPNIALIKFYPDDRFLFRFKPCAVLSVAVDYTAGGSPSFFKKTKAPTLINISMLVKEIDLWTRQDYRQNAYR